MSRYVPEPEAGEIARAEASEEVEVVGGIAPCREMKGLGWRVFRWSGRLFASVIDSGGDPAEVYEEIREDGRHLYDDTCPSPGGGEEG